MAFLENLNFTVERVALTMVAGRSQDSLCEASEVHNEIWQMLLVTHYSFTARLAAQGAQCSGWKRRFKKSKDESSTTCSDGFERLHSMAIERRSACRVHTIGDLTRFLYIFFYVTNQQGTIHILRNHVLGFFRPPSPPLSSKVIIWLDPP